MRFKRKYAGSGEAQNLDPAIWEVNRRIPGDWLMRGRFPEVYPTGSFQKRARLVWALFLCNFAQLLASEQLS